ncbi:estradiol 17-beta-dehydrogenase 11-like [Aphidius gifuensis]|uniref:estradiol 17-beta-dehydrogenase 11-like n=1 Tax=Aphidius gifuensis TaxID=684658 RepID=UPI001CDD862F|nr:estradiol 17-beta-dehydrogenase 11-like [Aphidius gifuensis]
MNFRKTMSIVFDIAVFIFMAIIDITKAFLLFMIPRKYKCKSVQGEVVLITGGASGIGRLIAIKLAGLGAHIVIWDIDKSGIEKVVNEIKSLNGNCTGYICDITKKNEVYKIAKTVKKEIGNVTILVNNAGYVYTKTIVDSTDEQIEKIFKTNILSHFWTTKSFLPNMMKNNHGHIVTISSMAGFIGGYRTTGYSTTKYATVGYHKSLFTELNADGYDGIHMTLVCPYFIHTIGLFPNVRPRILGALDPNYTVKEIVFGILTNKKTIVLPSKSLKLIIALIELFPTKSYTRLVKKVYKAEELIKSFSQCENLNIN